MEKYAHTTRARETKPKLAAIVKGSLTCMHAGASKRGNCDSRILIKGAL
jgi:hypothetical protein